MTATTYYARLRETSDLTSSLNSRITARSETAVRDGAPNLVHSVRSALAASTERLASEPVTRRVAVLHAPAMSCCWTSTCGCVA